MYNHIYIYGDSCTCTLMGTEFVMLHPRRLITWDQPPELLEANISLHLVVVENVPVVLPSFPLKDPVVLPLLPPP